MRDYVWTNADGLEVGFGRSNTKNLEAGTIEVKGQVRQLELEVFHDEDNAGASVKNAVIPAGAVVLSATVYVKEAFVGGTDITVGSIELDGTNADADAFATGATAALTAGAVIEGAGALVGKTSEEAINVTYETNGAFTAGHATVLIEYINPSAK